MNYREAEKKRLEIIRKEIAQLSAWHRLTGYDNNVLRQWLEAGARGRRPKLSFEIEEETATAKALEEARRQREWEADQRERIRRQERDLVLLKERQEREDWRKANPERAALRDERRRRRQARECAAWEERKQLREIEEALESNRRRIRELVADGGIKAILALNEDDWRVWSEEIATADQLEAFTEMAAKWKPERPMGFFNHLAAVFGFGP